ADLSRDEHAETGAEGLAELASHAAPLLMEPVQLPLPRVQATLKALDPLFLLLVAAAEDAAQHVARTERHTDARDRVLPYLGRHVVTDRREFVRPDVVRAAFERVTGTVHELADPAAHAAARFHRFRASVDLLAHALHPLGRAALAGLHRRARFLRHALLEPLGLLLRLPHPLTELGLTRLLRSAGHPPRADIPAHCHDTSSAPAAVHRLRAPG